MNTATNSPTVAIDRTPIGSVVDHPSYGRVSVVRPVNRDGMNNLAGFGSGVWIDHPVRGIIPVSGYTMVAVVK